MPKHHLITVSHKDTATLRRTP